MDGACLAAAVEAVAFNKGAAYGYQPYVIPMHTHTSSCQLSTSLSSG